MNAKVYKLTSWFQNYSRNKCDAGIKTDVYPKEYFDSSEVNPYINGQLIIYCNKCQEHSSRKWVSFSWTTGYADLKECSCIHSLTLYNMLTWVIDLRITAKSNSQEGTLG